MVQAALVEVGRLAGQTVNALLAAGFSLVVVGFPVMLISNEPRLFFAHYFGVTIVGLLFLKSWNDRG